MIKLNKLFWQLSRIASAFAIFGLLLIVSCSKDDEKPAGVSTVQFANEAQTVSENAAALTINIPFDKAAEKSGIITVTVTEGANTEYGTHFTTSPNGTTGSFEIEVSKGQTSAQFTFTPINNALLADDKTVELTISDVSSGFEIGVKDANTITIIDDEGPTQANFAIAASSTTENLTAGIDVTINLSSAAPGTGTVTVAFTSTTATYTTNFTTEPAATAGKLDVAVAQGATSVTFKVKPVDDASVNAVRTIAFTLDAASGAVVLGTAITAHTFTITDDETPSVATFEAVSSSIGEGVAAGITIPLTLAPQTTGTGTVGVTFAGGTYGDDFTTDPAAVAGKITVPVASGVTTASFKVIPVNNDVAAAAKEITFTLSESAGIVTLGTAITHELTIEDDDAITTIAQVRSDYPGTTTDITSSKRIRGVVTSSNPQVNNNNIWVQDATGGIVVRLVAANANAIERGDEVSIQLNGGQYFEFNGLLQIQNVPNANVTIVNEGVALPAPEVVTVAELNTNAYEGKLVRISDVAFVDANGTATMSGTRVVSNGTLTTNIRTETTAPHTASVLPYGFGTITGLAGENLGAAQIIPISFVDDVFASSPVGTINVTQAVTDFGSVNNGAESASQSFTVTGTTLTQSIVVTATAGFEVSTNNVDFTPSVTLSTAGGTVHVRFAPASGTNQVINGSITSKSLGAAPASFNVSGTEAGNAASNLLLLENFNYSLGELTTVASTTWTVNSGAGTNNIPVVAGALTFAGYPSSNVGNSITLATTGQDAFRGFTSASATSGDLYVSFLMNVTSAQAAGDYVFALLPDNSTSNYTARTFIKSSGSGFVIGISKGSVGANETAVYGATEFAFSTTYLVVIKYSFIAGATNDAAVIHVLSSVPGTEPGSPAASNGVNTNADQVNLGRVGVRQGSATNGPAFKLSGIRVATTWAHLFE
jgi:hypothetical protein